jgi:K+-transporting ATPase ATPase C chain
MKKNLITSIKLFAALTIITGIIYPLCVTVLAQITFPFQSNGSIINLDGKNIGSELIGQDFSSNKYFKGRPSSIDHNPMPSGGSNLGPASARLIDSVQEREQIFRKTNALPENRQIPSEMLFASASGVDPQISPESALMQVNRICSARGFDENKKKKLLELINRLIEKPQWGIFGESRINVLLLNIELDKMQFQYNG